MSFFWPTKVVSSWKKSLPLLDNIIVWLKLSNYHNIESDSTLFFIVCDLSLNVGIVLKQREYFNVVSHFFMPLLYVFKESIISKYLAYCKMCCWWIYASLHQICHYSSWGQFDQTSAHTIWRKKAALQFHQNWGTHTHSLSLSPPLYSYLCLYIFLYDTQTTLLEMHLFTQASEKQHPWIAKQESMWRATPSN